MAESRIEKHLSQRALILMDAWDLVYPFLALTLSVGALTFIRVFGKISSSFEALADLGPDLNLFTYGFLADVSITALRGEPYWKGFDSSKVPVNKQTALIIILLLNLFLTLINLKLRKSTNTNTGSVSGSGSATTVSSTGWIDIVVLVPSMIFLGVISLSIYVVLTVLWK